MRSAIFKAIFISAFPIVVFFVGGYLMLEFTGKNDISEKSEPGPTPLNQRPQGYDETAVSAYWDWLKDNNGLVAERRFLEMDLIFPTFYGGAALTSVLIARKWLRSLLILILSVVSIAATVLFDWIENLVQLQQLDLFIQGESLQTSCIQLASSATTTKLIFGILSALFIIYHSIKVWKIGKNDADG